MKSYEVSQEHDGVRIDKWLAMQYPQYSRTLLTGWIKQGFVSINKKIAKPKDVLKLGQEIEIHFQEEELESTQNRLNDLIPEPGELNIVHEQQHYLVVLKPAGLVVHPGAGVFDGTLANKLVFHYQKNQELPNYGLIHRLDKDTSGLMVIAKTHEGYHELSQQMLNREITRLYLAFVHGLLRYPQTIATGIVRHPHLRLRKAVSNDEFARQAINHVRIVEKFEKSTLVECQLETGRTHQIRLHMEHIKHPIIGDSIYHGPYSAQQKFPRQALHAYNLKFFDVWTQEDVDLKTELPDDMQELLTNLRNKTY